MRVGMVCFGRVSVAEWMSAQVCVARWCVCVCVVESVFVLHDCWRERECVRVVWYSTIGVGVTEREGCVCVVWRAW